MSHAALVNKVVFWLIVFMAVLLALFLCAVIWTAPAPPRFPAAGAPAAPVRGLAGQAAAMA